MHVASSTVISEQQVYDLRPWLAACYSRCCRMFSVAAVRLQMPNEFLTFRSTATETRHPIRLYTRYINKVCCVSSALSIPACPDAGLQLARAGWQIHTLQAFAG